MDSEALETKRSNQISTFDQEENYLKSTSRKKKYKKGPNVFERLSNPNYYNNPRKKTNINLFPTWIN